MTRPRRRSACGASGNRDGPDARSPASASAWSRVRLTIRTSAPACEARAAAAPRAAPPAPRITTVRPATEARRLCPKAPHQAERRRCCRQRPARLRTAGHWPRRRRAGSLALSARPGLFLERDGDVQAADQARAARRRRRRNRRHRPAQTAHRRASSPAAAIQALWIRGLSEWATGRPAIPPTAAAPLMRWHGCVMTPAPRPAQLASRPQRQAQDGEIVAVDGSNSCTPMPSSR